MEKKETERARLGILCDPRTGIHLIIGGMQGLILLFRVIRYPPAVLD